MPLSNPSSPQISIPRNVSASASSISNSLASTASNVLVNANPSRRGLTIYNNLQGTIFVDTSNAVATNNFMVAIPPGAYFELPASDSIYTGALHAILSAGTGSALVREFV